MPEAPGWRVRGMATAPEARGRGYGAAILAALLDHVRAEGGGIVWCHARVGAVPLYERAGFVAEGEPYEMGDIGLHRLMCLKLH
jgi:GNAT superfamily N-acetyltransferase